MPVVNQITRSPGLLNFNRFSPHTFHLDKKVEVFAAEGSLNHESPGQLKFRRFSARNHQFTLENQAYTTPHHIPWITLRLKCIHIPTVLLGKETKCACAFKCTQCPLEQPDSTNFIRHKVESNEAKLLMLGCKKWHKITDPLFFASADHSYRKETLNESETDC